MVNRTVLAAALIAAGLSGLSIRVSGQSTAQPSTKNGEWPYYSADLKGTRYSPLDQINGSNFNKLEIAWRFKTDNLGPFPEFKLEGTPLMVKGVLYTTGGTRRSVIALDGKTGELIWAHSLREGKRAAAAPRQLSGRGVAYWTDGRGDERVLYITTGYRLVALNAKNGAMIPSFGKEGMVDLKVGVVKGVNQQIDLETGEIGSDWYPAPIELAQIDHRRFPYAIALGLILAMRWRWDWLDGRDHCPLSGEKLLEAAGIPLSRKNPGKTWDTLRHTLEELKRRDALGRYEWTGEPWTLAGICRLYPPPWARERTVHGLTPIEAIPPPQIVTGAELRAWRERKGWTQQQTATALGVSLKTLKRAEQTPSEPLGKAICQGLGKLGETSSTGRGQKAG